MLYYSTIRSRCQAVYKKRVLCYNRYMKKIILDLCGGTGAWSRPYRRPGYDVHLITSPAHDVRTYMPPPSVHGVLAAPPCTHLCASGARWWEEKGESALLEALSIVDACLRIVLISEPAFWVLENPIGRLVHYLGPPKMYFQPSEFGDPWTKRTCLWGDFNIPTKNPVEPTEGGKIHRLPPSPNRSALRSITPAGFAKAFFEANP
jgi:hypothetical protein